MLFILLEESRLGFTFHGSIEANSVQEAAKSIGSMIVRSTYQNHTELHRLIENKHDSKAGFYLIENFLCPERPVQMGPVRKIKMVPVEVK